LKSCSNPEVVQASLGLLLTLSKSPQGCQGLLAVDLSQMIWLPLSSINKKLDKEWIRVFTLALQLALNLIKVGQQHALDHILTVVALLQEQLTAFLIGPKNGNLEKEKMDLTAAAATLIGHLMPF
jgi:cell division inhibitor SulA